MNEPREVWTNDIAYSALRLLWGCHACSRRFRSMREIALLPDVDVVPPHRSEWEFYDLPRLWRLICTDLHALKRVPAFGLPTQFCFMNYSFTTALCFPEFPHLRFSSILSLKISREHFLPGRIEDCLFFFI